MSEYVLAGPDIGSRLVGLVDLIEELGPEAGAHAIVKAETTSVVIAASDPMRLVRRAEPGDDGRSFTDLLAMVDPDQEPPPPARPPVEDGADEDDEEEDHEASEEGAVATQGRRVLTKEPATMAEAVDMMVEAHRTGEQSFFNIDADVTIRVPYRFKVVGARDEKEARAAVRRYQEAEETLGDHPDRNIVITFDYSDVLGRAAVSLRRSDCFERAGWEIDADKVSKLSDEEMRVVAQKLVSDRLARIEEEAAEIAGRIRETARLRPY